MSRPSTLAKIAVIAMLNFAVVGCSSLFAVRGDGSGGDMYWVLGIGGAFVAAFAIRAFLLAERGKDSEAISVVSGTLLYAFAAGLVVALAAGFVSSMLK